MIRNNSTLVATHAAMCNCINRLNDGNDWLNTIRRRKFLLKEQLRIPTLLQFYVRLPFVILSMNPYSNPVLCEVALCHTIYESLLYCSSMWGCPLSFYLWIPTLLQFYVGLPSVILSMNPYSTPVLCEVALCHSIYESLLYSSSMWGCPLSFYLWILTLLQFYARLPSVILSMNPYSTPVLCGVALCHTI